MIPIGAVVFSVVGVETWALDKASVMLLVNVVRMESVVCGVSPEFVSSPVSAIVEGADHKIEKAKCITGKS